MKFLKNNRGESDGISLCGVLLIVFIVLKLCKLIDWSWLWVLSPLWIPFVIFILAELIKRLNE